ncbi:ion transporter [Aurantivibrio infirmus]
MTETDLKQRIYIVIFGTDTPAGKRFDLMLICAIVLSVAAFMLDSIESVSASYGVYLTVLEWIFTLAFTIEYGVRIYCSPKPIAYMRSGYGVIDLLSVLPTYLSFFFPGTSYVLIIRLLRVLRIFRILKLVRLTGEANILIRSILASRRKILVFFSSILVAATIIGSFMYLIEGAENGFTSIPKSVYWTIVTITTVGYGDITPHTVLGQTLAALTMLIGYSVIAVPTGILTAELATEMQRTRTIKNCQNCNRSGHEMDANYCRFCGVKFPNLDEAVKDK